MYLEDCGDDVADESRGVGLWTEIASEGGDHKRLRNRAAGAPVDLDQLSSDDEIFTNRPGTSTATPVMKSKHSSTAAAAPTTATSAIKEKGKWKKEVSPNVKNSAGAGMMSIFRIAGGGDNDMPGPLANAAGQWNRADLPTRGLSDPISDGFTMLGGGDDSWPFPIEVNYSTRSSRGKFASSSKTDDSHPVSPSCSSATPSLGTTDAGDDEDDDEDDDNENDNGGREYPPPNSSGEFAVGADNMLAGSNSNKAPGVAGGGGTSHHFSPPSTAGSSSNFMPQSPIVTSGRRFNASNVHTDINTIYNAQSTITALAPSTPTESKGFGSHRRRSSHSREEVRAGHVRGDGNGTSGSGGPRLQTVTVTETETETDAAHSNTNANTNTSSNNNKNNNNSEDSRPVSTATSDLSYDEIADGIYDDNDDNDCDDEGDGDAVGGANYTNANASNGSNSNSISTATAPMRIPNGIFNIDEEMLDSSLGEDFLSLFAAPRKLSAKLKK
jgi:hypothetical protein